MTLLLPALAASGPLVTNRVYTMDALALLRALPDASVNAVITDPPYPEVDRDYGRLTEDDFHVLMHGVVKEIRRILKPKSSAVFVLQPNSEKVGRMRTWLWDFMSWVGREWNIVQDAYWWNFTTMATVHCSYGLMRPSVKYLVWVGDPDCYRDQSAVLWHPSDATMAIDLQDRALKYHPSGHHFRRGKVLQGVLDNGGASPFNLLPMSNTNSITSGGANGHGAATPHDLIEWWIGYVTRPGDIVCDPFMGSGTVALTARAMGRLYIGSDKEPKYVEIARRLLSSSYTLPLPLPDAAPVVAQQLPLTMDVADAARRARAATAAGERAT